MNGAFTIFYFIGGKDDMTNLDTNPALYSTASILAAIDHVFSAPRDACDNCAIRSDENTTLVTGTSSISPILLDYIKIGKLRSLGPDDVVPFLQRNLYWRVLGVRRILPSPMVVSLTHYID